MRGRRWAGRNETEAGVGGGNGGAVPARGLESDQIAAVVDDVAAQLDPRRMVQLTRLNAEIEADIGENGGDRAAAVLGGDLLECGRAGDEPVPRRVVQAGGSFAFAAARVAFGRRAAGARTRLEVLAAGGALAEPFLEGGGTEQAACDAVEDEREIAGVEGQGDEVEAGEELRGGGV